MIPIWVVGVVVGILLIAIGAENNNDGLANAGVIVLLMTACLYIGRFLL